MKHTSKPNNSVTLDNLLPFWNYLTEQFDADGKAHHERVAKIALRLAEAIGLDEEMMDNIQMAALIHDAGKVSINDNILFKHGKFTESERLAMERHPVVGANFLRLMANAGIDIGEDVITIVLQHHENYDGTGYPYRVKNSKIHIGARVLRPSDYYEAITTQSRSYRSILPHNDALEFMKREKRVFDPKIFKAFCEMDFTGL